MKKLKKFKYHHEDEFKYKGKRKLKNKSIIKKKKYNDYALEDEESTFHIINNITE